MPEFRFRRKKKQQQASRRHTLHDPEVAHAQVAAAREMVKREEAASMRKRSPSLNGLNKTPELVAMATATVGGHTVSTGTLAREREKFFDLLRTKYPEHGRGIDQYLSSGNRVSEERNRYSRSQSADIETIPSWETADVFREEEREGESGQERRGEGGDRGAGRKEGGGGRGGEGEGTRWEGGRRGEREGGRGVEGEGTRWEGGRRGEGGDRGAGRKEGGGGRGGEGEGTRWEGGRRGEREGGRGVEGEGGRRGEKEEGSGGEGVSGRGGERESLSSPDVKDVLDPVSAHHHYSGCFFLRHGAVLRRCPIPSPITLSTLKNLLVNTFDLPASLLDDPMCYVMIQDRGSVRWKPLTNISDIYDHCILQLADPDAPVTNPTHLFPKTSPDTHSLSESPPLINTSNHHTITTPPSAHSLHHFDHQSHQAAVHFPQADSGLVDSTCVDKSFNNSWQSDDTVVSPPPPHPTPFTSHHSHPTGTTAQFGSPHSVTSSTSGVCSESLQWSVSPQRLSRDVRVIQRRVQELRKDYETYRKEQLSDIADFSRGLRETTHKITAAIRHRSRVAVLEKGCDVEPFRKQRLELSADKEAYSKCASETLLEVSILETAVEDIRRDVVERRCRVHDREVDGLIGAVKNTVKALSQTKDHYGPLETKIRRVVEQELTNIVQEEKFLEEEYPRLESAEEKCHKLTATLETLKQVASVQYHRTPVIPYFHPVPNPDRNALMENIKAVTPNHMHRVESIEMAKCVQHKKKELVVCNEGVKQFESQLRVQKDHLHKMDYVPQLEAKQEKKMIALYLGEKAQREEELAKEMKLEKKVAERKRQEEREQVKERLIQKQREDEKKRKTEQQKRVKTKEDLHNQSSAREENGEWFTGDDEDSLQFSSSFSSTISLLEHIRSTSGWTSDTQLKKNDKTREQPDLPKQVNKFLTEDGSKQPDESKAESHQTSGKLSVTQKCSHKTAPSTSKQSHSKMTQNIKDGDTLPAHAPGSLKPPNKQQETRPPQPSAMSQKDLHNGDSRSSSNPFKGRQGKDHQEPPRRKTDFAKHTQLSNSQAKKKGVIQPPTTGLQAPKPVLQKSMQPLKQVPEHKTPPNALRTSRQRVHINAPPATRRVASSDNLLEETASGPTKYYHMGFEKQPLPTGVSLADAPPRMRKSIGCLDEFDESHAYDVLEARGTATHNQPKHQHGPPHAMKGDQLHRGGKGLHMPTFPDRRPDSDLGVRTSRLFDPPALNSQPKNFDFRSNPSYKSGAESLKDATEDGARKQTAKPSSKRVSVEQTGVKNPSVNPIQNGHLMQPQPRPHKSQLVPYTRGSNAENVKAPIFHHSYTQFLMKPKPVKPAQKHHALRIPPGFGSSNLAWHSESDSSEANEKLRSVLSDNSSTRHSNASGRHSSSSDFSGGGHSESTTNHQARSQKTSSRTPLVQGTNSRSLHGDSHRNSSGLPVPRRRHHSHQHNQPDISSSQGHRRLPPQLPSHRQPNHIPTQHNHDEGALTSYPRFQRHNDHHARAQGQRTKLLSILPGTGQIAHFSKPVTEYNQPKSSRHPDVGSLV